MLGSERVCWNGSNTYLRAVFCVLEAENKRGYFTTLADVKDDYNGSSLSTDAVIFFSFCWFCSYGSDLGLKPGSSMKISRSNKARALVKTPYLLVILLIIMA